MFSETFDFEIPAPPTTELYFAPEYNIVPQLEEAKSQTKPECWECIIGRQWKIKSPTSDVIDWPKISQRNNSP
jgi:hypothetical protein